jgi:hypothetical protein
MLFRGLIPSGLVVLAMALLATVSLSAAQDYDRQAYARDYVRDLTLELDQFTRKLPAAYDQALLKPPVDISKVSAKGKTGADDLRAAVQQMAAIRSSPDLLTNPAFRSLVEKAAAAAQEINRTLGAQRFHQEMQSDWSFLRTELNYMFRAFSLETLADLTPQPAGRSGRGGSAANAPLLPQEPTKTETLAGYIVDQSCSSRRAMWTQVSCIETCIRQGDRPVLVTEDGKVYQISNLEKIVSSTYGRQVSATGKTDGEILVVDTIKTVE